MILSTIGLKILDFLKNPKVIVAIIILLAISFTVFYIIGMKNSMDKMKERFREYEQSLYEKEGEIIKLSNTVIQNEAQEVLNKYFTNTLEIVKYEPIQNLSENEIIACKNIALSVKEFRIQSSKRLVYETD